MTLLEPGSCSTKTTDGSNFDRVAAKFFHAKKICPLKSGISMPSIVLVQQCPDFN